MEQRKSDLDTGDGNVINVNNDGLNYSFDFSNQVVPDNNQVNAQFNGNVQPAPEPNFQANVQPMPEANFQANVQPMPMNEPSFQADVQPTPMPEVSPAEVQPTVMPQVNASEVTPVMNGGSLEQNVNVQPVSEEALQAVNQAEPSVQVTPVQEAVQPQVASEQSQNSEGEIIKDKKSTKTFLFLIIGIIVAFIIALPFIKNIIG